MANRTPNSVLTGISFFLIWMNGPSAETLELLLSTQLKALKGTSGAFQEITQAENVIRLALQECLPRYRAHHRDLLFHICEREFLQPYFLSVLFESLLEQGGPWSETDRIVTGTIDRLNDFVGFRPVAVLEKRSPDAGLPA